MKKQYLLDSAGGQPSGGIMRNAKTGWKYITVKRLKELLAECPDNVLIGVEQHGNLLLADLDQKPIGYIAMADGVLKRSKP